MRGLVRGLLVLAVLAFSVLVGSASGRTKAIDGYCGPSGDFCTSVVRERGRIKLVLRTFALRGRYELCVTSPTQSARCRSFRLRRGAGDIYASRVDFARNFSHRPKGRYAVTWSQSGFRIGPVLHFRRG